MRVPWFKILGLVLAILIPAITLGGTMWANDAAQKERIKALELNAEKHEEEPGHKKMIEQMARQETHYEYIQEDLSIIKNFIQNLDTRDYRGRD